MGFFDRNREALIADGIDPARLPPGQYRTDRWPVLHEGPVQTIDRATWTLRVWGAVDRELRLSYDDLVALGEVDLTTDLHCVTKWSRFDTVWRGVPIATVLDAAGLKPTATHTLQHAPYAYSTNLPIADLLQPESLVATSVDGGPIPADHGGPVRTLVPHLYLWKSVKWVTGIQVLERDVAGYWEQRGYHDRGDPFLEQRYRRHPPTPSLRQRWSIIPKTAELWSIVPVRSGRSTTNQRGGGARGGAGCPGRGG